MQRNIKAGRPSVMVEIKVIDNSAGLVDSLPVIRQAFNTVAVDQNLTPENCPAHSAFITMDKLLTWGKRGHALAFTLTAFKQDMYCRNDWRR